ncbi:hypothetical protein PRIPAC_80412 [Pristionchus pacificus]|nr:hypothetical protein PRIPAC_80412 [Pristionchus pacificus]
MRMKYRYVFAALAIIAVLIIFFKRFDQRPKWPPVHYSSQNGTIDIVLVVVDAESPKKPGISVCERVETLVKSILVFYSGTLHVHLLTNRRSGQTLSALFRTWPLARVQTSFYNVEEDQRSLEWVKSTHEVNGYGQLKYIIHDILPAYVDKAIFIDSDMLVLEDLSILHSYFEDMERKGIMFSATSDQYKRADLEKSLGKGGREKSVNSGLVLYNLKRMREGGWSELWRQTGVMLMKKFGTLKCPQDLLAYLAIDRSDTYKKLPCVYNFQIGKGALPWDCVKNGTELWKAKIPHWTGPTKYYETRGHTAIFSPIYRCFQKMDGYDFEESHEGPAFRTLINIRNIKREEKQDDVTLTAHVRYEEAIALIQRLNSTWSGPISLVVCGDSWERAQLLSFINSNFLQELFSVHFVYRRKENCPVEYLRRVAIDESRTTTVLLCDSITYFRVDDDLHKKCTYNMNTTQSSLLFKRNNIFAGVLLEKSQAQRIAAAGTALLEEELTSLKTKFETVEVEEYKSDNKINDIVKKWEVEKPTESFCRQEIDRRKKREERKAN